MDNNADMLSESFSLAFTNHVNSSQACKSNFQNIAKPTMTSHINMESNTGILSDSFGLAFTNNVNSSQACKSNFQNIAKPPMTSHINMESNTGILSDSFGLAYTKHSNSSQACNSDFQYIAKLPKAEILPKPGLQLSKRIAQTDALVRQVEQLKYERNNLQIKLQDLLKSVNDVTSMFENEKQQRLELERKNKELALECEKLNTDLVNRRLQMDQMEAQLEDNIGPIDYRDLAVRHLKLCQKTEEESSLHWQEKSVVKELVSYCQKQNLKVPQFTTRSPRKSRKVTIPKKEIEIQCDLLPTIAAKPILIDVNTQTEKLEMQNKACQYKVSTTTRGTATIVLNKYSHVGTNYNLCDTNPNIQDLIKEVDWIHNYSPVSPIPDTENNDNAPPPIPNIELATKATCTNICNVQRQVDYVMPPLTIKSSYSRPPSSLKFSDVKNENNAHTSTDFTSTFDELWKIFGDMLRGYLCRRSGCDLATNSPPITTNKLEFSNLLQTFLLDLHANGRLDDKSDFIYCNQNNIDPNDQILNPLIHHSTHPEPQLFSNCVPNYAEKGDSFDGVNYLMKPKVQRNDNQETFSDSDNLSKHLERQSIGTSPIRCIRSSPISSDTSALNESSATPHHTVMTGPSELYSQNAQVPSAFAALKLNDSLYKVNTAVKPSNVAEKILDLFPKVEHGNAKLESIKKLLKKSKQKIKKVNPEKQIDEPNMEIGAETAVDFITNLEGFKSNISLETLNCLTDNVTRTTDGVPTKSNAEMEEERNHKSSEMQNKPKEPNSELCLGNGESGTSISNSINEAFDSNEKDLLSLLPNKTEANAAVQRDFKIRLQTDIKLPKASNDGNSSFEFFRLISENKMGCETYLGAICDGNSTPAVSLNADTEIPLSLSAQETLEKTTNVEPLVNLTGENQTATFDAKIDDVSNLSGIDIPTVSTSSELDFNTKEMRGNFSPVQPAKKETTCTSTFATVSSNEHTLMIVTTDSEELNEDTQMKSAPKRRGRKRKSETISPIEVPEPSIPTTCKRSARLLAKQIARTNEMLFGSSPINSSNSTKSSETNSQQNSVVSEISISPDIDVTGEEESLNHDDSLNESPIFNAKKNCNNFITSSPTPPSNEFKFGNDPSMEILPPPASPPPPDNNVTTILPPRVVCAVKTHQKMSEKTQIRFLIDNFEDDSAILSKSTQIHLPFGKSAQLQKLQNAFKEYFTSPRESKLCTNITGFCTNLLQSAEDMKLFGHALVKCMQYAPRPPRAPYEQFSSKNMPAHDLPTDVHCSTSWHERLPCILNHLNHIHPEFIATLPNIIETMLFNSEHSIFMSLNVALNLTEFYLILLVKNYIPFTTNPARLFIAKCYFFHQNNAVPMVYAVLKTFPTVIPHSEERSYDRSDALITVIQHYLMCTFYDMSNYEYFHRELLSKARFEYHYFSFKPTFEEVLTNLVEKLKAEKFNDLSYAFAVFCKRQRFDSVMNDVLESQLVPLSQKYYSLLQQSTEYDARAACLLECFSCIVKSFVRIPKIDLKIIVVGKYMDIFKRFLSVVKRPLVQEAAVLAILRLQHYDYNACFFALLNFKPNFNISPKTNAALKTFIHRKPLKYLKYLLYSNKQLANS